LLKNHNGIFADSSHYIYLLTLLYVEYDFDIRFRLCISLLNELHVDHHMFRVIDSVQFLDQYTETTNSNRI